MRISVIVTCMSVLWLFIGCSKQSGSTEMEQKQQMAQEETSEALQAVGEYAEASKEAMERELGKLSDKLDVKLKALRDESGAEVEKARAEIKEQKKKVAKALENLGNASSEQWEDMKQDTADVVADVEAWLKR